MIFRFHIHSYGFLKLVLLILNVFPAVSKGSNLVWLENTNHFFMCCSSKGSIESWELQLWCTSLGFCQRLPTATSLEILSPLGIVLEVYSHQGFCPKSEIFLYLGLVLGVYSHQSFCKKIGNILVSRPCPRYQKSSRVLSNTCIKFPFNIKNTTGFPVEGCTLFTPS